MKIGESPYINAMASKTNTEIKFSKYIENLIFFEICVSNK